jgi:ribonuclease HI
LPGPDNLSVYTDGAARGNPGPAAIGYAMYDSDDRVVDKDSKAVGVRTNNQAEYEAFIWALERVVKMGAKEATFYSDSELLVRQVNGRYRIKNLKLRDLHDVAQGYIDALDRFEIEHVSRQNERTERVDAMINEELDEYER